MTALPARGMTWIERVMVAVFALNAALLLAGVFIVPSTVRTPGGVLSLAGALLVQGLLALAALRGPFALRRWRDIAAISFALGAAFAAAYLAIVLAEFLGVRDNIVILEIFAVAAAAAGFIAGYRRRDWRRGLMAGAWALVTGTALWTVGDLVINYIFWSSPQQYAFMLFDGAVDDFHRAGGGDWYAYLLQDIQGATIFHPVLSVVVGSVVGAVSGALAHGLRALQGRVAGAA